MLEAKILSEIYFIVSDQDLVQASNMIINKKKKK